MKKLTIVGIMLMLLAVVFIVPSAIAPSPPIGGGDGSPASPFNVTTCDELDQTMSMGAAGWVVLGGDIDCTGYTFTTNAAQRDGANGHAYPSGYRGLFNGYGFTIYNYTAPEPMYVSNYNEDNSCSNGMTGIVNVRIVNPQVNGTGTTGVGVIDASLDSLANTGISCFKMENVTIEGGFVQGSVAGCVAGTATVSSNVNNVVCNQTVIHNEDNGTPALFGSVTGSPSNSQYIPLTPPCTANWSCSGYDVCLLNDTQVCNAVTDSNNCGQVYGGNYSEFSPNACNYCTPSWACSNFAACLVDNSSACLNVTDITGCYDSTGLVSDSFQGTLSTYDNLSCNYQAPCSPSWVCTSLAACAVNNVKDCLVVTDANHCNQSFGGSLSTYNVGCSYNTDLQLGSGGASAYRPVSQTAVQVPSGTSAVSGGGTISELWASIKNWFNNLFGG